MHVKNKSKKTLKDAWYPETLLDIYFFNIPFFVIFFLLVREQELHCTKHIYTLGEPSKINYIFSGHDC